MLARENTLSRPEAVCDLLFLERLARNAYTRAVGRRDGGQD